MIERNNREQSDLVPFLSRRGLLKKAGLLGVGALGIGSVLEGVVPGARAEGTQSFLHPVQRLGTQSGGGSPQRRRKTVNELLTILQSHPGGTQAIEAARRGGANFSFGEEKPILPIAPFIPPFSVVFAPGTLKAGKNHIELYRALVRDSGIFLTNHQACPCAYSHVSIHIEFPREGWYLVNMEGVLGVQWAISAKLEWTHGATGEVQTWGKVKNTSNQPIVTSFPALYQYKKSIGEIGMNGMLKITGGSQLEFLELSVEAL